MRGSRRECLFPLEGISRSVAVLAAGSLNDNSGGVVTALDGILSYMSKSDKAGRVKVTSMDFPSINPAKKPPQKASPAWLKVRNRCLLSTDEEV
eukprot:41926-Hanusia_phi.AAC.2